MIRVLLAEDQKTVQELLKSYLEQEPDFEVVAVASDGEVAIEQVEQLKPDLVLMDIEMSGIDGLTATEIISQCSASTKVLILSIHDEEKYLKHALQVGAKGYLLKNTPPEELVKAIRSVHKGYSQLGPGLIEKVNSEPLSVPSEKKRSWHGYFALGIFLNTVVWALVLLYLKLVPPIYTSKWGVKLLGTDPGVEVVLPSGGRASSSARGSKPTSLIDAKNDYIYIATSRAVLEKAAQRVGIPVEDFGQPEIAIDKNRGIIDLQIKGKSSTEAPQKAWALHQIITEEINRLRKAELERQEQETQATLEKARQKLNTAQEKLSGFQTSSGLSSVEQVRDISLSIENLRRQQAELLAQQKGLDRRREQLSRELELSSVEATDAYRLEGDEVYKQQLAKYAEARADLANVLSQFTPEHPQVIEAKALVTGAGEALQQRASVVLGKQVSQETLARIAPVTFDPKVRIMREELSGDLVTTKADQQKLVAQNQELERQIAQLELHLRSMNQEKFKLDSLSRDLQIAEAVFSATLAKLDLGKENIYSIYPPVQLVAEPSLPDTDMPTSPNTRSILLGGVAASFLVTTGLILLWFDKQRHQEAELMVRSPFSLPPQDAIASLPALNDRVRINE